MADNPKPLADRVALVTGASRGIGAALALELAKAGAHIVAVARTVGGLEELDDRINATGSTATLVPLDLKDTDGIVRLAGALHQRYGRLDVLVGNAGLLTTPSPVPHIEPKHWDEVIAVNATANWHLIRACDPLLRASDAGRAVFVTSGLAWMARPYFGAYATSKAALDALVCTYAAECANTPVRVNLFSPGQTRTRMMQTAFPGIEQETLPAPEEVVKAIVPLCLPHCVENGRLYDFREGRFLSLRPPS
ncbi:MAG TPA: SDR family NAD(P)-dependent oxidoreductase [Pseudolabrys sp.]|jgi:NAD(P)-dependent dehydrogenase (short-subunit alcohol dehydrogenase family)|nr:SDR family NAD(P)-dependent oxidoreductase [Pseudolabrys sp.]